VVVVDLLGNVPEWRDILDICRRHGILVIEDAAEGIGATYEGEQAGQFGEVSLFSFNATKLIMSGQGGAYCTNDKKLYNKAKIFSHHGIDKSPGSRYYWSNVIGYNYNWTNIQAALALAQLRRIRELIDYKKWLFGEYSKGLGTIEGIQLSAAKSNVDPTYWISVAIVDKEYGLNKDELCHRFNKYNIDMRPIFYPISSMPPFQPYVSGENMRDINPVSYQVSEYGICLPNGNNLNAIDVEYICSTLKNILGI
jgi:perosamine synthetase